MARKLNKDTAVKAPKVPLRPFAIGLVVMFLVLAAFNAQLIVASVRAYIIPDTSEISETTLSDTYAGLPRIVIPKINVDAPVVYGMNEVEDDEVQAALQEGVLHFGGGAEPGKRGNAVYVGHSSGQPWAPGGYNFIFMRLTDLTSGDKIYLYKDGVRHIYEVYDTRIVKPNDVSVLENTGEATATLITCSPVGTNINRLVIHSRLITTLTEDSAEQVSDAPGLSDSLSEHNLPGSSYDPVQALRARFDDD